MPIHKRYYLIIALGIVYNLFLLAKEAEKDKRHSEITPDATEISNL